MVLFTIFIKIASVIFEQFYCRDLFGYKRKLFDFGVSAGYLEGSTSTEAVTSKNLCRLKT